MASYIGGVYTGGTTDDAGLSTGENHDRFQPGFRPAVSDTTDFDRELAALEANTKGASTAKNYYDLTNSVVDGEILMFGGGTFDPEALNRPEFLNAIIQTAPRIEYGRTAAEKSSTQGWATSSSRYRSEVRGKGDLVPDSEIGEVIKARMDAFANALMSVAPTGVEGQKAVKEFYRLAAADIASKGLGSLSVSMRDENGMQQAGNEPLSSSVVMSMSPAGIAKRANDYAMDPNSFNADIEVQIRSASGGESQEIADDLGREVGTFGPETVDTDTRGGTNFDPRMTNTLDTEGEEGGGSSNAGGLFRPQDISPEVKEMLEKAGIITGNSTVTDTVTDTVTGTGTGDAAASGEMIDIQSIISTFKERFGMDATVKIPQLNAEGAVVINPTTGQPVMVDAPNPLLEQLLDLASVQNGFVSSQQIQVSQADASVRMEQLKKESAVAVAYANGASDEAISRIETASDFAIASAQQTADRFISQNNLTGVQAQARAVIDSATATATGAVSVADIQSAADTAIAQLQADVGMDANAKDQAIAEIQAAAEKDIATTQAGGQVDAAQASAGAASPYGFLQQGGTSDQLEQVFAGQNAVGMAQANPYGQTAADRQKLQETQFNPYALTNAQGYGLGQANAANNPYAAAQLGQGQEGIDQILRGGLSAEQRIAEINAGQSGQNQANFLNFIGNPSAVGFATESGLFSPGQGLSAGAGSNVLQDISNAESGNIPGSLFGFNPPTATGAGGASQNNSGGTTENISGYGGNFNANTLRNASDEQIGFMQGAAAAGGQTQSEFQDSVQAFTPQGV